MKRRKAIPVKTLIAIAIQQANECLDPKGGFVCPLCQRTLYSVQDRILEHMTPHATRLALGLDPDAADNLRWVHKECAHRKTYGTKATTAGSDAHAIAKGKRFDRVNAGERSRKRRGPKMKSKGFDKTKTRKFSGATVPRTQRP